MSYIDDVFGSGGLLEKHGYEHRPGQVQMARAIDESIATGSHVVCEAPTGTGKSSSYSVPAAYHAANNGKRVLIVTANKALQAQLINKDLPALQKILPWSFTFALAKGRSNYGCWNEFNAHRGEVPSAIADWFDDTEDGDLAELAQLITEPIGKYRHHIAVDSDGCIGKSCVWHKESPDGEACFANQARAKCAESSIVVANYSLLFAHVDVFLNSGGEAAVLPPFDVIICDEAHRIADIAREAFGDQITVRSFLRLSTGLPTPMQIEMRSVAKRFFEYVETLCGKEHEVCYVEPIRTPHYDTLKNLVEDAKEYYSALNDPRSEKKADGCDRMLTRLNEIVLAQDKESVFFMQKRPEGALCRKRVEIARTLRSGLWKNVSSAVCTSATLSVAGSMDFFVKETGLPIEPWEDGIIVDSPFDYGKQCKFFVDTSMPHPSKQAAEWELLAAERIVDIVRANKGRCLLLFTSDKMLRKAREKLVAERNMPYEILVCDDPSERMHKVKRKMENPSSVLLGLASFWEGIDLPGEACTCVVMDRLPFPTPNDPIVKAKTARVGSDKAFLEYSIPFAAVRFKQGFGRLIRTKDDYGCVVMLDPRLVQAGFGKKFTKSLPQGVEVERGIDWEELGE